MTEGNVFALLTHIHACSYYTPSHPTHTQHHLTTLRHSSDQHNNLFKKLLELTPTFAVEAVNDLAHRVLGPSEFPFVEVSPPFHADRLGFVVDGLFGETHGHSDPGEVASRRIWTHKIVVVPSCGIGCVGGVWVAGDFPNFRRFRCLLLSLLQLQRVEVREGFGV
jgi:hypothetical protein